MTESQWMQHQRPDVMLRFLLGHWGIANNVGVKQIRFLAMFGGGWGEPKADALLPRQRKLQLFAAACCREFFDGLSPFAKTCVMEAEQVAEGSVDRGSDNVLAECQRRADRSDDDSPVYQAVCVPHMPLDQIRNPLFQLLSTAGELGVSSARVAEILRDVVGVPHSQPEFKPIWASSEVRAVLRRAPHLLKRDDLARLCDDLLEKGCPDGHPVIEHLRSTVCHVRGCWAVALVQAGSAVVVPVTAQRTQSPPKVQAVFPWVRK